MKLKLLLSFALAWALVAPSSAQSVSPLGHYAKKRGGAGEMLVQNDKGTFRVFVSAGGTPNGGATAADCTLIAFGAIKGNVFQGDIKYRLETPEDKPGPENEVDVGHKMTITFAPKSATLSDADIDQLCGAGAGVFGPYVKDRRRAQ